MTILPFYDQVTSIKPVRNTKEHLITFYMLIIQINILFFSAHVFFWTYAYPEI